ncbi:MAG: prohibitin family protein [Bacteroidetes bacterium]|nr:prohibitin family protein [Bacteroidota bacterium]
MKKEKSIYLFVSLVVAMLLTRCTVIHPGEVGLKIKYGKIQDRVLLPGAHPRGIFGKRVVRFDSRIKEYEGKFNFHTEEGIEINADITLTYHLIPDSTKSIYTKFGKDYQNIVIVDNLVSVIRVDGATHKSSELLNARSEMEKSIKNNMNAIIKPYGFEVDLVLLQHIALPPQVVATIEAKMNAVEISKKMEIDLEIKKKNRDYDLETQKKEAELEITKQRLALDFVIEKQKKETERLLIESEGLKKSQDILNSSITDKLIKFKSLDITKELVKSSNTKIIITDGKSPVILSDK